MKEYLESVEHLYKNLNSSPSGLDGLKVKKSASTYGVNEITKSKQKSFFKKLIDALLEPMLVILEISFFITLGVNIGKFIKTGSGDFFDCIGIAFSILLSVILTLYMEDRSKKAFELLNKLYDKVSIKVIRDGAPTLINQTELVVGDIVLLEQGDKAFADGRLIESNNLTVDESMLTGESSPVSKNESVILKDNTPLAERKNMIYSGCFVTVGSAKYIVTAVGDNAEIGKIASDLQQKNTVSAPLQEKLDRLGKKITWFGVISAVFVLILTIARLFSQNSVSFDSVQDAFLNAIVLIIASVPEGLPTTVAISLSLNVLKLSKSNALIKKLIAAETIGCVSVICSDKTGTLTENKMTVSSLNLINERVRESVYINCAVNSTADVLSKNKLVGNPTETALLLYLQKNKISYKKLRAESVILNQIPFSSQKKYMATEVESTTFLAYVKGAPEIIINSSNLPNSVKQIELEKIKKYQLESKRVIAFARCLNKDDLKDLNNLLYDGFAVISDPVRKDVLKSILDCKKAGIKVKMLTGDNVETAYSIAKELDIVSTKNEVLSASDIDGLSDNKLKKILTKINVVARSTPKTKLRVVSLLKEMGEVVAVTGDGVNDAPAIKHADIGIAMGSSSEITKEASDIVLLDNSFSTIVTAIAFGRGVYQNFRRFISFQLSVNFSAVLFIVISLVMGVSAPFSATQMLWINVIMDGPPALTLALEQGGLELMNNSPVKRSEELLSKRAFVKVFLHAVYVCLILTLQIKFDFIGCGKELMKTVIFSLFILFQLFNAFNSRELGSQSVFKNLKSNKTMLYVLLITFLLQIVFTQVLGNLFETVALPFEVWVKMTLTAFSVILMAESYKFIKRTINANKKLLNIQNRLIKKKNNA